MFFKKVIYFLCLLVKRDTLTKPDLPIIGPPTQGICLFVKTNKNLPKLYQYKKNKSISKANTAE